jgi:ribosomal protein S11
VLTPTSVALVSALPAMRVQMNVIGNNLLTLDGTNAGAAASGFTITTIRDVTPIPHNGCRPPKRRRV